MSKEKEPGALGPLPLLKKYELSGPAIFSADEVVRIEVQETKDTDGIITGLQEFVGDKKLRGYTQSCGGGAFLGYFNPEDAKAVITWLKQYGVKEARLK